MLIDGNIHNIPNQSHVKNILYSRALNENIKIKVVYHINIINLDIIKLMELYSINEYKVIVLLYNKISCSINML